MEKDNHHYPELRMGNSGVFCLQSTTKVPPQSLLFHPPGKTNVRNDKNTGIVQEILALLEESSPISNNILIHLELERFAGLLTIELKRELCTPNDASLFRNSVTQWTVSRIRLTMSLWRTKANLHVNCYSKQVYTKAWQITEPLSQNSDTVLINTELDPGLSAGPVLGEADLCWLVLTKLSRN